MHLRNGKRRMPSSWTVISPISACARNALEVFFFYSKIDSLFAVNEEKNKKETKKKLKTMEELSGIRLFCWDG